MVKKIQVTEMGKILSENAHYALYIAYPASLKFEKISLQEFDLLVEMGLETSCYILPFESEAVKFRDLVDKRELAIYVITK